MLKKLAFPLIITAIASPEAMANPYYVDFSMGQSSFSKIVSSEISNGNLKSDRSDLSYTLLAGYSAEENISFEFSYQNLGEYSHEIEFTSGNAAGGPNSTYEFDLTSFSLMAVPSYSINKKIGIFGKIGHHWWDIDGENKAVTYSNGVFQGYEVSPVKLSGSDLVVGIGASYKFENNIVSKLNVSQFDFETADLINISLSIGREF